MVSIKPSNFLDHFNFVYVETCICRNMYCKLKYVVIFLKLLTNLVILRSFENCNINGKIHSIN